jgi:hypothetical protein
VKFVFREEDDNVDELLEVVIPALDENVNCQVFQKQEAVETQGTGLGTIEYWLYYNVCHGLTQP